MLNNIITGNTARGISNFKTTQNPEVNKIKCLEGGGGSPERNTLICEQIGVVTTVNTCPAVLALCYTLAWLHGDRSSIKITAKNTGSRGRGFSTTELKSSNWNCGGLSWFSWFFMEKPVFENTTFNTFL